VQPSLSAGQPIAARSPEYSTGDAVRAVRTLASVLPRCAQRYHCGKE
jgi:hypothetical protein